MLPPSLAGWMSSTPAFLLWSLQHTSRPDFPLANLPVWLLVNFTCDVWSRHCKLLGISPVFLDFLQKMPAISQKYLDQLSPMIRASRQGPGTKAFEHYKMIVAFQHCLLKVTQDTLHLSSLSSTLDLGPLQSAPAPIGSILLNPITEAAAVVQLAGAWQFVCEKGLATGSRKQTQQTKSQNRQRETSTQSSSKRAVPVTAPDGFEYAPPPTPPDHAAAPVSSGQVAVAAVAKMLGEFPKARHTMIVTFGTPVKVLATLVETRYSLPSPPRAGFLSCSQMSLASLEGLKLLLEAAALLAGMDGSLEQLMWLMQPTLFLLIASACGTSFEQRQAFIADRGDLLLQVLWRVGKAMSDESQQQQPVLGDPDALVQLSCGLSQRGLISIMVELLDVLVRPCSTGSSLIAGKDTMQFMIDDNVLAIYCLWKDDVCACVALPACVTSCPRFCFLSALCRFKLIKLICLMEYQS